MPRTALIEAAWDLNAAFSKWRREREEMLAAADTARMAGELDAAEREYLELLRCDPRNAPAWSGIGEVRSARGQLDGALDAFLQALEIDPLDARYHHAFGSAIDCVATPHQAMNRYHAIVGGQTLPGDAEAHVRLGNTQLAAGSTDGAIANYLAALRLTPADPTVLHNLAVAFDATHDRARSTLFRAAAHFRRGEFARALPLYREAMGGGIVDEAAFVFLGDCYRKLGAHAAAAATWTAGLRAYPTSSWLHLRTMAACRELGHTKALTDSAHRALHACPDDPTIQYASRLVLPIVYANRRAIEGWRRRYARGLTALEQQTSLRPASAKARALDAIGYDTNFYLAYQGRDDRALQRRYGRLVCRVMSANYPQYTRRRPMPGTRRGRIRIGYVSAFMRHHAVASSHLGWLRHADRNRFAIHAYHLGPTTDAVTDEFRRCSDTFHHIPERLEDLCAQATGDNLHLLVHLDIGMFPRSTQLAGLRLAPVQCTTWGHPVTSGLRTIDYFISSDLMEPVHADRHYTERLIRLPNLGIAYMKPERPRDPKSRQAFGIREDATVFLCCQSPFKYLPQYDQVLVRIARRVPGAQFVFVAPPPLGAVLQQRLARAFTHAGLDAKRALLFLTGQSWPDYLSLMLASDVFLDTFEWSGCNTALEALALGLPVVTCPGRFLRGRHGYAFLTRMGLTDTLAPTPKAFIEIAVRLGLDAHWRRNVVERLAPRVDSLYEDREPVIALERFYSAVVAAAR